MSIRTFVVSGVSRGLGQAIFDVLIERRANPIGIGRSLADQHRKYADEGRCRLIKCDLSVFDELAKMNFAELIGEDVAEVVFISNAGMIEPIARIGCLDERKVNASILVNILAPIVISNKLAALTECRRLSLKVINVTSGAANRPLAGWSAYCTGKAAAKAFFGVLRADRPEVEVVDLDVGLMDTDMQKSVRDSSEVDFPGRREFERLHLSGELRKPSDVACEMLIRQGLI